jgi:hypothetical protein
MPRTRVAGIRRCELSSMRVSMRGKSTTYTVAYCASIGSRFPYMCKKVIFPSLTNLNRFGFYLSVGATLLRTCHVHRNLVQTQACTALLPGEIGSRFICTSSAIQECFCQEYCRHCHCHSTPCRRAVRRSQLAAHEACKHDICSLGDMARLRPRTPQHTDV